MKTFTIDDVLSSGYCDGYDESRIRRLWGDRETATALDVLNSHLPHADRVWLVLNLDGLLSDETVYTFRATLAYLGADIYERYYQDDDRVRKCAEAWHALARGECVDIRAARDAAWDATMAATVEAAIEAASVAASASASSAAYDAAAASAIYADDAMEYVTANDVATIDDVAMWLRDIIEVYE